MNIEPMNVSSVGRPPRQKDDNHDDRACKDSASTLQDDENTHDDANQQHQQQQKQQQPSLVELIVFFLKEFLVIPLIWLTKVFTDYTNKRHLARIQQRYEDILASTEDFTTWRETARALDVLRGFETWKYEKPLEKYINAEAIVEETRFATQLYHSRDRAVIGEYLRTHLSRDANGLSHPLQFRYYTGTKACVEQYITAVCRLIRFYANSPPQQSAAVATAAANGCEQHDLDDEKDSDQEQRQASKRQVSFISEDTTIDNDDDGEESLTDPDEVVDKPSAPSSVIGAAIAMLKTSLVSATTMAFGDANHSHAVDHHHAPAAAKGTSAGPAKGKCSHTHHLSGYTEFLLQQTRKSEKAPNDNNDNGQSSSSPQPPSLQARYRCLHETALAYGRSALMLSGGASLGVYHAGVCRALFIAGLLPQIITGSSAGAIIGSIVCSRTDEELVKLFNSGNGLAMADVNLAAFEQVDDVGQSVDAKLRRLFKSGAFMDVSTLSECLKQNVGDLTFREAFERTGRILNISVSSASRVGDHQDKALLLNYLTAPNVLIWNAVSASCAMPGLFTAVELLEKIPSSSASKSRRASQQQKTMTPTPTSTEGTQQQQQQSQEAFEIQPFLKGQKFYDGSVAHDLPKEGIATLFNVNYFIVSQTNPHVIPFLGGARNFFIHKRKQRSLLKKLWFAGCSEFGHWLSKLYRFNLIPKSGNFAVPYLLHSQPFEGDLTIFPIGSVWDALPDYVNLTANPSVEHLEYVTAKAQRRTWPYLSQIFCVSEIERTLMEEIRNLHSQMKLEGTKIELEFPLGFTVNADSENQGDFFQKEDE